MWAGRIRIVTGTRSPIRPGGEASGKVPVIGAISRKGNVVCKAIENTRRETLYDFVKATVSTEVTPLATDEHPAYGKLGTAYPHQFVRHNEKAYVRGNVHNNNIENFWSLLKRGVIGTFHNVSADYLPLYLAEFTFRHNFRRESDPFALLIQRVSSGSPRPFRTDVLKCPGGKDTSKGRNEDRTRRPGSSQKARTR
jgi:hypothetical protein